MRTSRIACSAYSSFCSRRHLGCVLFVSAVVRPGKPGRVSEGSWLHARWRAECRSFTLHQRARVDACTQIRISTAPASHVHARVLRDRGGSKACVTHLRSLVPHAVRYWMQASPLLVKLFSGLLIPRTRGSSSHECQWNGCAAANFMRAIGLREGYCECCGWAGS